MSVSINNSITVKDHEIIDDLELVDESVTTQIVDALFTSTVPDWKDNDPNSPYFIKNKPTKTSDFTNDGADGTSRYVEYKELQDLNKVNDVQVKVSSQYNSVLGEDKIARVDLSGFVQKEFKTGSTTQYKVLSDNNYTDTDKNKVNSIQLGGDGNSALTNNGQYKPLYNILTVNDVAPDSNKNIKITAQNIEYTSGTPVKNVLDRAVLYKSATDKQIVLGNSKALLGTTSLNNEENLININSNNTIDVGSSNVGLNINSSARPTVNSQQSIAYLSDIDSKISAHNLSNTSHEDIRNIISDLKSTTIIKQTNSEIASNISHYTDGQLIFVLDEGEYKYSKIYKYNSLNNSLELVGNYQYENIYKTVPPTSDTIGYINQLYIDIINLRIYYCSNIVDSDPIQYVWIDITPAGSGGGDASSEDVQNIINNTTLISDENGGFTAGNNYRLLDSDGLIPLERIPDSVLTGIKYGGSFNSDGIITASSIAPEINGQDISTISILYYKNYYFHSEGNYTLGGIDFVPGNFAYSTGVEWVKIDNPGQVVSVNGKQGIVVLTSADTGSLSLDDANTNLMSGQSIRYDGDNVYLDNALYNLSNKETSTATNQINLANDTTAGLMSTSDYQSIRDLQARVGQLEQKATRLLYTASTTPTADEINTFVTGLGYTAPFEGIAVVVEGTNHVWHYYEGEVGWKDDGVDVVANFTNTSAGIILGSQTDGKVYAETDGTGSVYGWGDLKGRVGTLETNMSNYVPKTTTVAGKPLSSDVSLGTLKITKGGADYETYDGSEDKTIDLSEDIGFDENGSFIVGNDSEPTNSIGITNSTVYNNSIKIGRENNQVSNDQDTIAIGINTRNYGPGIVIGNSSQTVNGVNGIVIGNNNRAGKDSVVIGQQYMGSVTSGYNYTVVIGSKASTSAANSVTIGYNSKTTVGNSIQLGTGTNSTANTFQVFNYQLLDATGKIPLERLPDGIGDGVEILVGTTESPINFATSMEVGKLYSCQGVFNTTNEITDTSSIGYNKTIVFNSNYFLIYKSINNQVVILNTNVNTTNSSSQVQIMSSYYAHVRMNFDTTTGNITSLDQGMMLQNINGNLANLSAQREGIWVAETPGTAGQVLTSTGSGAPVWSDAGTINLQYSSFSSNNNSDRWLLNSSSDLTKSISIGNLNESGNSAYMGFDPNNIVILSGDTTNNNIAAINIIRNVSENDETNLVMLGSIKGSSQNMLSISPDAVTINDKNIVVEDELPTVIILEEA